MQLAVERDFTGDLVEEEGGRVEEEEEEEEGDISSESWLYLLRDCCLGLTAGGTSRPPVAKGIGRWGAEIVVEEVEGGRVEVPRAVRRTGTGGGEEEEEEEEE